MKRIIFTVTVLILISCPFYGRGEDLNSIVNNIQKSYNATSTFKAKFLQESYLKSLNKTQTLKGEIFFKKPGKMLWNYSNGQKIVSDGANLWIYQPKQKQVIQTKVSSVGGKTPADFLIGVGNIGGNFTSKLLKSKSNQYLLELTPKETGSFSKIVINVDNENFQIHESSIYDFFGNITKIKFKNIKINEEISNKLFDFKAPKGVEIIKQ